MMKLNAAISTLSLTLIALYHNQCILKWIRFSVAQYQQNVGGHVISDHEYIRNQIVTSSEIRALLDINSEYNLTIDHFQEYERNGFVVLENFLNMEEAEILEKVAEYNLDQFAFPDLLTSCNRKFHGEFYHSSATWRFWQQPRFANMLSKLALGGETAYMVTSEILEMRSDKKGAGSCIPQWHWDFLTFPQNFDASYKSGTQIWMALNEKVDATVGGGLAFMPGSHLWANEQDENSQQHPCFVMNLFDPMTLECKELLENKLVIPTLNPGDIVVFSRFTLHRSVPRSPDHPFESGRRLGYTLRIGSGSSIYKKDTMKCFPSHPTTNFAGQLQDGQRYDSVGGTDTDFVYRPMGIVDTEERILQNPRKMSMTQFLRYSFESLFRQKIHYKLFNWVEESLNSVLGEKVVKLACRATPTPDVSPLEVNDRDSLLYKEKNGSKLLVEKFGLDPALVPDATLDTSSF